MSDDPLQTKAAAIVQAVRDQIITAGIGEELLRHEGKPSELLDRTGDPPLNEHTRREIRWFKDCGW